MKLIFNRLTPLSLHGKLSIKKSWVTLCLLALSLGHRLCVNFYVSRAIFLTTLRSHLDVTCSYYFWSSLFNVDNESLHTLDK